VPCKISKQGVLQFLSVEHGLGASSISCVMLLHSTLLHVINTSFATLLAWMPVVYAALILSFHHQHCQLCSLNRTELAICTGLAVPVFEALCIREVSWA
jgi:hypothetical protein